MSFIAVMPLIILLFNSVPITYQDSCVDGDGDINLEGMMCEKSYDSYFGLNKDKSFNLPRWSALWMVLVMVGAIVMAFLHIKRYGDSR